MIGRTVQVDRTSRTGQAERDRATGLAERDRRNRTGKIGQTEIDRQNRINGKRLPRTGWPTKKC